MFNKLIKLIVVTGILYQTPLYSKSASFNDFNSRDLSNYFSGIIAFENKDNSDALKFFNASKVLLNKHDAYLKRYVYSLVLEDKVAQAINIIENSNDSDQTNKAELLEKLKIQINSIENCNFNGEYSNGSCNWYKQ